MLFSSKINKPARSVQAKEPSLRPQLRALPRGWFLAILLVLCGQLSCSNSGQPDEKLLVQAYQYHEQALQQSKKLQSRLLSLESQLAALKAPQDALAISEKIKGCRQQLLELEMNVTEVPGYEHGKAHGDQGHHHHHGHGSGGSLSLSPEQHFKVQQAYLQATEEILFTTDSLTAALQQLINLQEYNSEE